MKETTDRRSYKMVVIGGGISGLAAAHRLMELRAEQKLDCEITLIEQSARLGGVIQTERREGFLLEGGPDSFISEKPEALELAKRLGLAPRLIETNEAHRRSFVVRAGKLRPVPEGFHLLAPSRFWPFVVTDIFSWAGKARMAFDLVLPRRAASNSGDGDESLAQFVRRRFGKEALERMAQPMVGGIYTADPERLSLRATMPRFLEMEREHRSLIRAMWKNRRRQSKADSRATSGARYSLFLSFDEGMQTLVAAIEARLQDISIKLNTKVDSLAFDHPSRQWSVRTRSGETIAADAVCLALPAYAAADLLRDTDAELAAELAAVPYASTATINLAFKSEDIPHPMDGFGFVVPAIERRATLACTFASVKFKGRAPRGHALLRAFVGGALQPEMFELEKGEMVDAVRKDLRALLGIEKEPVFTSVEKWPRSMAQYHLGHVERVNRIKNLLSGHTGLKLAGNAFRGAGIPDCIRSGVEAADDLLTSTPKESQP